MTNQEDHQVPVKVYKSKDRLTVAAPMPGIEPQDIEVTVSREGDLMLNAGARGRFKGENEVLINEWEAGAYHRTVALRNNVDATRANATYENGVLVVSLPLSQTNQPARIELDRISSTEGLRAGASGHAR
ncbi:MAG TPA: Hsp20/alpha crystallin family protein [Dehalococcoidia bacterium]|nr:Hsp20/alpha crystallin family protein [Dehalococcoidia bacterium]